MSFETYRTFAALRQHFARPDYDFFLYNGKVRVSPKTYENHRDRHVYERVARHRDPVGLMVACLVEDPRAWIGEVAGGNLVYVARRAVVEDLTNVMRAQVARDLDVTVPRGGFHPPLLRAYLAGRVPLEVASLAVETSGCADHWRLAYGSDPVVQEATLRLTKYAPFVEYDRDKARAILVDIRRRAA